MNMPGGAVYPSMERLWATDRPMMLMGFKPQHPHLMAYNMLVPCVSQCRRPDCSQKILAILVWMDALLLNLTWPKRMRSSTRSVPICSNFLSAYPELCLVIALPQPVRWIQLPHYRRSSMV